MTCFFGKFGLKQFNLAKKKNGRVLLYHDLRTITLLLLLLLLPLLLLKY